MIPEELYVFMATFVVVFLGELGDKTQVASGVGALANRGRTMLIFGGSAAALVSVSAITTFLAGFIPASSLPTIEFVGGIGLVFYGLYLTVQAMKNGAAGGEDESAPQKSGWALFGAQFGTVFLAELGDKTQVFTAGAAVENNGHLTAVFLGSSAALVTVTALTVWGVSFIPQTVIKPVQVAGAVALVVYGLLMIF